MLPKSSTNRERIPLFHIWTHFNIFLVRVTVIGGELFSFILSLYVIIALKNVTLVSNKKSILVEMLDFSVTQVDNFCKNEVITVMFKLFEKKRRKSCSFQTGTIIKFVCSNAQLYPCNND